MINVITHVSTHVPLVKNCYIGTTFLYMKHYFVRIWNDIRAKKHIETYLTITLALMLLFLDVFGVTNVPIISAGILATLTLLALSILKTHHANESLESKVTGWATNVSAGSFFSERLPGQDLEARVKESDSIDISGITLLSRFSTPAGIQLQAV